MAKEVVEKILSKYAFTLFFLMSRENYTDFVTLAIQYGFNVNDYKNNPEQVTENLIQTHGRELAENPLILKQIAKNSIVFEVPKYTN